MSKRQLPLITIGIIVLNREWVIGKVLNNILSQTYPHEKIFVLVVDGGSIDKTIEICRMLLEKSDFYGFEIILQRCNIPEGRNICIERMLGDFLLFWDSDILMEPDAIQKMVETLEDEKADIVTADTVFVFANTMNEAEEKIKLLKECIRGEPKRGTSNVRLVPACMMGHTLIRKEVFSHIKFDPDLTLYEDMDFSVRARKKGFKIMKNTDVIAFDINLTSEKYSDIFTEMPIKDSLRGLRKKAKAKVLSLNFSISLVDMVKYYWKNKRYLMYLSYLPVMVLLIPGFVCRNWALIILPFMYPTFYMLYQARKRGFKKGLAIFMRSFLVGFPLSLLMIYYFARSKLH
ncbi:MAG: glycosyltransferase [Candidatus Bathyarchaeia archaeon]